MLVMQEPKTLRRSSHPVPQTADARHPGVRSTQDWLFNIRQIDVDHCRYSASASASSSSGFASHFSMPEYGVPGYDDRRNLPRSSTSQDDVGVQVFDDRFFVQLDSTPAAERSADASVSSKACSTFNPADLRFPGCGQRRCFSCLSLNGQQTLFDRIQRDRVYQIARVMPGCILPLKRTRTDSGISAALRQLRQQTPPDQNPPGKDTDRETGMGVTTGTDGIRQHIRFSQE